MRISVALFRRPKGRSVGWKVCCATIQKGFCTGREAKSLDKRRALSPCGVKAATGGPPKALDATGHAAGVKKELLEGALVRSCQLCRRWNRDSFTFLSQ